VKPRSAEAKAFLLTAVMILGPCVGIVLWIWLMVWLDSQVHADGVLGSVGSVFGLPALFGGTWGAIALYKYNLKGLRTKESNRAVDARRRALDERMKISTKDWR
jgi:hypothetical protein